jgi:hypothetical protein
MNPDPKIDCDDAAIVVLAGREWFIPVLAMRQSRIVVPGLMRLMPLLGELQSAGSSAMAKLGEEEFDIILAVVHAALTRAYPQLTREAFLDLAISTPELIGALGIVTRQTGFFRASGPGEKILGEAQGETPAPLTSSTG